MSFTPRVATLIATGNFPGKKFGLNSETGYTVSLKRTNVFELAAQFTAICKFPVPHYLRQTRIYYPESWGFLCPTQTPEGENCGLYNYLASRCQIVSLCSSRIEEKILFNLGVIPCNDPLVYYNGHRTHHPVLVDGKIVGWINSALTGKLLLKLRELKSSNNSSIPRHSEIVYISKNRPTFPGVYLFSSSCRMVRRVYTQTQRTQTQKEEYIGVFEQVFLQDTCSALPDAPESRKKEIPESNNPASRRRAEKPTSPKVLSEVTKANILSLSARMIPFCEHNAAVRNIFSSEKCKQALGLPFFNWNGRSDSKTHQLVYGQSPVVSSRLYSESNFDLYPHGTNVTVAVVSYSGYDMEDAIVLNRASVERGLMQNVLYKTIYFDFGELATVECHCTPSDLELRRDDSDPFLSDFLDKDGLPSVGTCVRYNDPILSMYNRRSGLFVVKRHLERGRRSYVHSVRLMGDATCTAKNIPKNSKKLAITFYAKRVPEEGDKFTNRHGGKGVCSALMRQEDLPFTVSGMVPDLLLNPNGLPSRMSVGVLFEMAMAKAGTQKGCKYRVEPFESERPGKIADTIGEALMEGGFSYYGTEKFYSGTSGLELQAEVFCGSIYFLRLHHMVEEKYQFQSAGAPVDERTNQPTNPGRSGAVRFGEMERDAILSHGASELTRDRLLLCSDKCTAFVCSTCHTLICPILQRHPLPELRRREEEEETFCRLCSRESTFRVQIPYVLCYLVCELAVLGISVRFSED